MNLAALDLGSRYIGAVVCDPWAVPLTDDDAATTLDVPWRAVGTGERPDTAAACALVMGWLRAHGVAGVVVEIGKLYFPKDASDGAKHAMATAHEAMFALSEMLRRDCAREGIACNEVARATWAAWLMGGVARGDRDVARSLERFYAPWDLERLTDTHRRDAAAALAWAIHHDAADVKPKRERAKPSAERAPRVRKAAKKASYERARAAQGVLPGTRATNTCRSCGQPRKGHACDPSRAAAAIDGTFAPRVDPSVVRACNCGPGGAPRTDGKMHKGACASRAKPRQG